MSNKSTVVALALLSLLAVCSLLGAFASWELNSATSQAATLATEATTANSDTHAVSVCVGLFNIGACSPRQATTAAATNARPTTTDDDLGPNPWPLIIPLSAVLMLAVTVIIAGLDRLDSAK